MKLEEWKNPKDGDLIDHLLPGTIKWSRTGVGYIVDNRGSLRSIGKVMEGPDTPLRKLLVTLLTKQGRLAAQE